MRGSFDIHPAMSSWHIECSSALLLSSLTWCAILWQLWLPSCRYQVRWRTCRMFASDLANPAPISHTLSINYTLKAGDFWHLAVDFVFCDYDVYSAHSHTSHIVPTYIQELLLHTLNVILCDLLFCDWAAQVVGMGRGEEEWVAGLRMRRRGRSLTEQSFWSLLYDYSVCFDAVLVAVICQRAAQHGPLTTLLSSTTHCFTSPTCEHTTCVHTLLKLNTLPLLKKVSVLKRGISEWVKNKVHSRRYVKTSHAF